MQTEPQALFWALFGNTVVGFGAGTATLAAFSPTVPLLESPHPISRVLIISIGFAFFFAGYHITQAGTYRDPADPLHVALLPGVSGSQAPEDAANQESDQSSAAVVVRGMFIVIGVVGLGAGMRLFALTIASWNPTLGGATGLVCIGGYICGHIGINGVLI